MTTVHAGDLGWHAGEQKMHAMMGVTASISENPTSPFLTPGGAYLVQVAPLLVVGTLDDEDQPWTTIWGGEPGFARSLGSSIIGMRTLVDREFDPVVRALFRGKSNGEVVKAEGSGRALSGLSIDLATRRRVKLAGRMVAGSLGLAEIEPGKQSNVGEMQLVVNIESSLGNCPKYLNKKDIIATTPSPTLLSSTLPLSPSAIDHILSADLFFLTSSTPTAMSTNHRGGPPGFLRLVSNTATTLTLAYPEYSGNRLYQTLGNLTINPLIGLAIPSFTTGNILYLTGSTTLLTGSSASALLPHSNLVVKITATRALFVGTALPFRGQPGDPSPYNPPIRYLSTERSAPPSSSTQASTTATLISKSLLTPTIARFRFRISDPKALGPWSPGQYVALSFAHELSAGYSHMRDEDPRSINDDYVRTFTVSSPPGAAGGDEEFEITIRNVGVVTDFLLRQNPRAGLEVPLLGFAGDFSIEGAGEGAVPFVAGGIGVTPLLGQVGCLELGRVRLWWMVGVRDLGLVRDVFARVPGLVGRTRLFVSGAGVDLGEEESKVLEEVERNGARVVRRRVEKGDIEEELDLAERWYICVGPNFKTSLLQWLAGKEVVYEDFGY